MNKHKEMGGGASGSTNTPRSSPSEQGPGVSKAVLSSTNGSVERALYRLPRGETAEL